MQPNWQNFLAQHGAQFDYEGVTQFTDSLRERHATDQETVVCDLSPLGFIKVSGDDAQSFLQAQLTNDISDGDQTRSQLNAYCNPKGRMLALFRVFLTDEGYLLQTPKALLEDLIQKLKIFVFRAQVKIQPANDEFVQIGVSGPGAVESLESFAELSKAKVNDSVVANGLQITRIEGKQPRFLLFGDSQVMQPVWNKICEIATPVGYPCWSWLDIQAGVPSVLPGNIEELIPQMVNLDVLNGISFTKGCFPGQEIVARLRYLGKLKQRMTLLSAKGEHSPNPGDSVYIETPDQQRKVGRVVNAQTNLDNGYDLLAVLNLDIIDKDGLIVGDNPGMPATIETLPYSLPTAETVTEN